MRGELSNPVNPNDRRRIARMNHSIRRTNGMLEYWRNRVVRPEQSIPLPREIVEETSLESPGYDLVDVKGNEVIIFSQQPTRAPFFSEERGLNRRSRRPLMPQEEEREITSVERERGDSWVEIMDKVRRGPIGKRNKKIV